MTVASSRADSKDTVSRVYSLTRGIDDCASVPAELSRYSRRCSHVGAVSVRHRIQYRQIREVLGKGCESTSPSA